MKVMHATLAGEIVKEAQKTTKEVLISQGNIVVDAKSILGLLSLIVEFGDAKVLTEDMQVKQKLEEILHV